MVRLKLLIVDDIEENRSELKAVCTQMEGFDILEASDGVEALEIAEECHPHIILMDVMLQRLDGFQASKIIKERHPDTIIMVLTTVIDPQMEKNMVSIGVTAYVRKPVDKELIRFKLQNFRAMLCSKRGVYYPLSQKKAVNLFNSDIRGFRTMFDITDIETMMDYGMWILGRCEDQKIASFTRVDTAISLFYELMRHGMREGNSLTIVVEESYEEMYATIEFEEIIDPKPKALVLLGELGKECMIRENTVSVRLRRTRESLLVSNNEISVEEKTSVSDIDIVPVQPTPHSHDTAITPLESETSPETEKEVRVMQSGEKEMLRQSFVHKTTAVDYVREIGGDVLDEIRDLESLDAEWKEKLRILEDEHTVENIRSFADSVLGVYVRAINNLFEFTALAYALSSLGSFLKEHADVIVGDPKNLKKLVMLLEHLGADLESWRDHIFSLQDTADIHYLDSSFFSSCVQIEGIIGNKEVASDDDDDGMEFF